MRKYMEYSYKYLDKTSNFAHFAENCPQLYTIRKVILKNCPFWVLITTGPSLLLVFYK
jgi:hypothetical protein